MAVVYVAARIKAGSSVSPLKGATRRSIGPFGTLPRGAFCYLTRGQPVSSLLPPILPLRLLFIFFILSPFTSNRGIPLVSFPFHSRTVAVSEMRTHDVLDRATPFSSGLLLQPARGIFFSQGLRIMDTSFDSIPFGRKRRVTVSSSKQFSEYYIQRSKGELAESFRSLSRKILSSPSSIIIISNYLCTAIIIVHRFHQIRFNDTIEGNNIF